jgi:AcrR family transcriptional regulator
VEPPQPDRPDQSEPDRETRDPRRPPQRADGRRNQARVLAAAFAAFATRGATVSIREIAREAGVSTGTVSRHFPTKDALFRAVVLNRIEQLVQQAGELAHREDPHTAFFTFFTILVTEGAADHAVADALSGAGFDLPATASAVAQEFEAALAGLLARAQQVGAVREGVDTADVKALISGCLARGRTDHTAQQRMITISCDGLRPAAAGTPPSPVGFTPIGGTGA